MLGDKIFGGEIGGPSVFMTDDSVAEQAAIRTIWPKSRNLLCIFHVLQSVWRWLIKAKHGIPQEKQALLYNQFKNILHAPTEKDCIEKLEEARKEAIYFQNYDKYLMDYWNRRELWAKAYRNNLSIRGNHTNNYSEAAMRVLKDKIFNRVKAFNVVEMVDFLKTKFVSYYKSRLLDAAHNRTRKNIFSHQINLPPPGFLDRVQVLGTNFILVPSEKKKFFFYTVNMDVLICGCFNGNTGVGCKHIHWASMVMGSEKYNAKIDNIAIRKLLYFIATGSAPRKEWFQSLYSKTSECSSNPFGSNEITGKDLMQGAHIAIKQTETENMDEGIDTDCSLVETSKASAKACLTDITAVFTKFIDRSPIEVATAFNAMYESLQKIKSINFCILLHYFWFKHPPKKQRQLNGCSIYSH